jgi:hypothetical protein
MHASWILNFGYKGDSGGIDTSWQRIGIEKIPDCCNEFDTYNAPTMFEEKCIVTIRAWSFVVWD